MNVGIIANISRAGWDEDRKVYSWKIWLTTNKILKISLVYSANVFSRLTLLINLFDNDKKHQYPVILLLMWWGTSSKIWVRDTNTHAHTPAHTLTHIHTLKCIHFSHWDTTLGVNTLCWPLCSSGVILDRPAAAQRLIWRINISPRITLQIGC